MTWRIWLAVVAVALVGVVAEFDWQATTVAPPPSVPRSAPAVDFPPPPSSHDAGEGSNAPVLPNGTDTAPAAAPRAQATEETAPPGCNVDACRARYKSFRISDCTYQPNNGPRRLCRRR